VVCGLVWYVKIVVMRCGTLCKKMATIIATQRMVMMVTRRRARDGRRHGPICTRLCRCAKGQRKRASSQSRAEKL
jgi:hypothetical protein